MSNSTKGRVRPLALGIILLLAGIIHDYWWMWSVGLVIIVFLILEAIFYEFNTRPLD